MPVTERHLLRAQNHVLAALAEVPDLASAPLAVLEAIGQETGCAWGGFWLVDELGALLLRQEWRSQSLPPPLPHPDPGAWPASLGQALSGLACTSGCLQWVEDLESDSRFALERPKGPVHLRHGLAFPLPGRTRSVGAVAFLAKAGRPPDGDWLGFLANLGRVMGRSIEQRQDEIDLRAREELYRTMLEQSGEAIFLLDLEQGTILDSNLAFKTLLGNTGDAGLSIFGVDAQEPDALREDLLRVRKGEPLSTEARRYRRNGGNLIDVEVTVNRLAFREGQVAVVIAHDLSRRKRVEAERDRLAEIVEASPDFVGIADPELRVVYRNRALRQLRGGEGAGGEPIWAAFPSWAARKVREEGLPTALKEGAWRGETAFLDQEGRETPTSQLILAHRQADGELGFLATIARDISDQKASLKQLNDLVKRVQDLRYAVDVATLYTVADTDDVILDANERFCQACGYSREELIGNSHRMLNSGYHPKSLFKDLWDTILAGRVWRGEILNRAKDGSCYWADSIIVPMLDQDGKPERFIALRTLITERKQAEAALLKRERQLELLARASRELNRDLDLPVVMRTLVETGKNLVGAAAGLYALLEGDRLRAREYFRDGQWESVDLEFQPGQGVPGWVMVNRQPRLGADARQDPQVQQRSMEKLGFHNFAGLPVLGRKEEFLGYFGIHDKTEGSFTEEDRTLLAGLAAHAAVAVENARWAEALRQEQAVLRQSEARYRTLVDQLHEGLAQTDALGHIIFANPHLVRMLGCTDGEQTEFDLPILASRDRQGEPSGPQEPFPRGLYEAQLLRKDGEPLEVLISESPLKDEAGNPLGGLLLISDNTEHKQAEELFRQAQKAESLTRMAGGIAHDFNNLFQGLMGNLELARDHVQDPRRIAETLERCLQILGRAAALSTRMLAVSGKGFLVPEPVQLRMLLRRHEGLLRDLAGPGCELSFHLEEADTELAGDPQQLLQVVGGLVSNAAEAGQGRFVRAQVCAGRHTLRTEDLAQGTWPALIPPGDYVALSVQDDGCGIAPEILGKVFDPFFSTKAPGRGLGLCSTLGIIRAHRGGLQVDTTPGLGTRIRIFLPPKPARDAQPAVAVPVASLVPRRMAILLVDDDEDLRSSLQEILEEVLGYAVRGARDGLEGVEAFQDQPDFFDLILMDATMPRLNGWEAFEQIKQVRPSAKALLISGFSETLGQKQAHEHGFLGFLKKPFSIQELREAIEKALGPPVGPPKETPTVPT